MKAVVGMSARRLAAALLLTVTVLPGSALGFTNVDGPICSWDFAGWNTPTVCATVYYNAVIDQGRVVVCGYDQVSETLYAAYAGQASAAQNDCGNDYWYAGNVGFDMDFSGAAIGTSVVFDGGTTVQGSTSGLCECSCPRPTDLHTDVGGNYNDWLEKSFTDVIHGSVYTGLPGFSSQDNTYHPFLFGIAGTPAGDKVWQALGNAPAINFGGGAGNDWLIATWPVLNSAPWLTWFGGVTGNDALVVYPSSVSADPGRSILYDGRIGTNLGGGNDLFYSGLLSQYAPDNAHNPFEDPYAWNFVPPLPPPPTMGELAPDTDRAMSNSGNIADEEVTGACSPWSSCLAGPAACPSWIESPIWNGRYPGWQNNGDNS
jgi:hypothetical protein